MTLIKFKIFVLTFSVFLIGLFAGIYLATAYIAGEITK